MISIILSNTIPLSTKLQAIDILLKSTLQTKQLILVVIQFTQKKLCNVPPSFNFYAITILND